LSAKLELETQPQPQPQLKKSLGLFTLIIYGVGDTLGAGIYALIGKTAGVAGYAFWMSFVAALVAIGFTAFTYAELVTRFPHAGGAAHYSFMAFRRSLLSYLVGFLVLMSGLVSMSTVSHGFAGYVQAFYPQIPTPFIILTFFLVLGFITLWGMRESSLTNIVCTLVEVSGLLIIIGIGLSHFGKVNYLEFAPHLESLPDKTHAVLTGAVLAFYAFIGFEDMVNVSEEVHEPQKIFFKAIISVLVIIATIYILTAFAAISVVSPAELSLSKAPLVEVVRKGAPWFPPALFTWIALFAVTNTALANYVMGTRLLYGMARDGLMPKFLQHVNPKRHTPDAAVFCIFFVVVILALTGTLARLAQSTALLLLIVFFIMNLSLIRVKFKMKEEVPLFKVPLAVPILGAITTFSLIFYVSQAAMMTVGILALLALLLYSLRVLSPRKQT